MLDLEENPDVHFDIQLKDWQTESGLNKKRISWIPGCLRYSRPGILTHLSYHWDNANCSVTVAKLKKGTWLCDGHSCRS